MSRLVLIWIVATLSACNSVTVKDYEDTRPNLDLKTFFNGDLKAYGIVQDFSGKVTRRFKADIKASWEGDTGILDEVFLFDDGERKTRIWRLTDRGNGNYSGIADDVVGDAHGTVRGSAFRWQ